MDRKAPLESLRLLWQHSPDSMFIIQVRDERFYLADYNPEQERAFPPGFDLSKPLDELLPDNLYRDIHRRYTQCITTREPLNYEEPGFGDDYWHTLLVPLVEDDGSVHFLAGVARNIKDLKQAELRIQESREQAEQLSLQYQQLNASLEERIQERTQSLQVYAQLERQRSLQLNQLNQFHQQAEELLKQMNACNSLEQALDFIEYKLPQMFRPHQVRLECRTRRSAANKPETWCWPLQVEDLHQGQQTPAYLHLEPDAPLQDEQQLEALAAFFMNTSERLSMSLSTIKLRQDLKRLSYEDGLTGLKNRRFMDDALSREITLAKRQKTPLSVLVCDIDHFKRFNDQYGHDTGDFVLRSLATALLEHFRETDLPCRYGGEEFVIIMPGATETTALKRAEELVRKLAGRNMVYQGASIGQVTISIGVASWPGKALTPEGLLKAADRALYQAKQNGRNRAVLAQNQNA